MKPSGDQPRAIKALVDGIKKHHKHQTLLGVTGSGKTYTMANIIAQTNKTTLILAPNKTLAAQLYAEMREFFPKNSVEYFVSYYDYYQPEAYVPVSDTFIEKDASLNEHIEQMRLSATKSLTERKDAIVVGTVSAIYGLGDPETYFKMILHIVKGDIINQRDILRKLTELQYVRNDLELRRGSYQVKGQVIDIFPGDSEKHAIFPIPCPTSSLLASDSRFVMLSAITEVRRASIDPSIARTNALAIIICQCLISKTGSRNSGRPSGIVPMIRTSPARKSEATTEPTISASNCGGTNRR